VKTFKGRPITKRYVNIGTGGQIETPADLLDARPRARVRFECEADYVSTKYRFADKGVEEATIIAIDASTFEILEVSAPIEPPEQPEIPGTETPVEDPA
jgi:hypothetical protein